MNIELCGKGKESICTAITSRDDCTSVVWQNFPQAAAVIKK